MSTWTASNNGFFDLTRQAFAWPEPPPTLAQFYKVFYAFNCRNGSISWPVCTATSKDRMYGRTYNAEFKITAVKIFMILSRISSWITHMQDEPDTESLSRECYLRGKTVDLLIKIGCFIEKVNNTFNIKRSSSKLFSTRRSTVLSLPLQ